MWGQAVLCFWLVLSLLGVGSISGGVGLWGFVSCLRLCLWCCLCGGGSDRACCSANIAHGRLSVVIKSYLFWFWSVRLASSSLSTAFGWLWPPQALRSKLVLMMAVNNLAFIRTPKRWLFKWCYYATNGRALTIIIVNLTICDLSDCLLCMLNHWFWIY